ncbi:MAG: glycosyltransferase family 2 protein [Gemmataceae bacterium]
MDAPLAISLIIPAFNEAAVIGRAIAEAESALSHAFRDFEILIVDDGSTDQTAEKVREQLPFAKHTRLIQHVGNRGYGCALRTGFESARFPLVAFTDADCQFHLRELHSLAEAARSHDIAVGYRVGRKDSRLRCFYSRGYNLLVRSILGTGVRDVDCALKVFQRDALASILPDSRGFFVNAEMLTRARQFGMSVVEKPVSHRPRWGGESKVSIREIPKTFAHLLGFWWKDLAKGRRPAQPATVQSWRIPAGVTGLATSNEAAPPVASPDPESEFHNRVEPRERRPVSA